MNMKIRREWKQRSKSESVMQYLQKVLYLAEEDILEPERDPFIWHLREATDIIRDCIEKEMPITIVGDYDADGMMASSMFGALDEYMDEEYFYEHQTGTLIIDDTEYDITVIAAMTTLATDEYIFAPTTIGVDEIRGHIKEIAEVYDSAISMEYANGSKYVMIKMVKLCE